MPLRSLCDSNANGSGLALLKEGAEKVEYHNKSYNALFAFMLFWFRLWEKGDCTPLGETMWESGTALVAK